MSDQIESSQTLNPATVSGQRMTVVVLIVLALSGALFYWVTTSYSAYNATRRQTERSWRELATQLEPRYRRWDKRIAQGVDARQIDMRIGEKWHSARDRFAGTTLSYPQIEAAQALEQIISALPTDVLSRQGDSVQSANSQPDSIGQRTEEPLNYEVFSKAVAAQRAMGQTLGSRALRMLLNLPDPPSFQPAIP